MFRQRANRFLASVPRPQPLSDEVWRQRHLVLTLILGLHGAALPLVGLWQGWVVGGCLRGAVLLALAVACLRLNRSRWMLEALTSGGLFLASAFLVRQTNGVLETEFHWIVMLAILAAYQSWVPLLVATLFVPTDILIRYDLGQKLVPNQVRWGVLHELVALAALGAFWSLESGRDDTERTIARLNRRHELIIKSAGEGIYGLDLDDIITFVNPAAAALLGWDPDDLIGRPAHPTIHHTRVDGSPNPVETCPIHTCLADGKVRTDFDDLFWRKDGTSFPVQYIATPVEEDGRFIGVVVTFSDITERLKAEAYEFEVRRLQAADLAHREVLDQLQDALRPPMPRMPGTEMGVCYLPADPASPTGGDLYDLQVLPDGSLHLVVVDVLGKGVGGTKGALTVTYLVRTLVLEGHPLLEVVGRADEIITSQERDLVATLVLGRYQPKTGVLQLAGGGHPPPLLISGKGRATFVPVPGGPIGWPNAGSDEVVEVALQPGDTVVLYTDGLVEANKDIEQGLAALADTAGELVALGATAMADELVDRLAAHALRKDDTLSLVLRRSV